MSHLRQNTTADIHRIFPLSKDKNDSFIVEVPQLSGRSSGAGQRAGTWRPCGRVRVVCARVTRPGRPDPRTTHLTCKGIEDLMSIYTSNAEVKT